MRASALPLAAAPPTPGRDRGSRQSRDRIGMRPCLLFLCAIDGWPGLATKGIFTIPDEMKMSNSVTH